MPLVPHCICPLGGKIFLRFYWKKKYPEMGSLVICLEDAIKDEDVKTAEAALLKSFKSIQHAITMDKGLLDKLPYIFVRIRNPEHLNLFSSSVEPYRDFLDGFVLPKFDAQTASAYMDIVDGLNKKHPKPYWFMPILETESIIYSESRQEALAHIKAQLEPHSDFILNIRVGATDFCSHFGIRRGKDVTIYQIQVVCECITDILNHFSRMSSNYVVSGPVWEYFPDNLRLLKPLLRATPFNDHAGLEGLHYRRKLIENNLDGLIREILLDKENGFIGKTVIHPSHILLVNALYVPTHEEYLDALSILNENNAGGVLKSMYDNKMNEVKPHTAWAEKIMKRAQIYGVFQKGCDYLSLLTAKEGGNGENISSAITTQLT